MARCSCVEHLAVDLNDGHWPELEQWLGNPSGAKTLVLMEASVPISTASHLFGSYNFQVKLAAGSQLVYDYKVTGEGWFCRTGRPAEAFRLSADRSEAARFHQRWGLHLEHLG